MRAVCGLLLGCLVWPAAPLAAQTQIVHVNRRGAANVWLVDLNTAAKDELMTLPSVSEADAERIIRGRPYDAKRRLLDDKVVSREVYDKIEKRVTTIPPPSRPALPSGR